MEFHDLLYIASTHMSELEVLVVNSVALLGGGNVPCTACILKDTTEVITANNKLGFVHI